MDFLDIIIRNCDSYNYDVEQGTKINILKVSSTKRFWLSNTLKAFGNEDLGSVGEDVARSSFRHEGQRTSKWPVIFNYLKNEEKMYAGYSYSSAVFRATNLV